MTVLIRDAKHNLQQKGVELDPETLVHELLYADDTLLSDLDTAVVEHTCTK